MLRSFREDLYTIVGTVDPQSKRATFKFHVNPFVSWIWIGLLVLIGGASVSLWPEHVLGTSRVWAFARAGGSLATGVMLSVWLAMTPQAAFASTAGEKPALDMSVASPLPRLLSSGAWLPLLFGLGLGVAVAYLISRRAASRTLPPSQ